MTDSLKETLANIRASAGLARTLEHGPVYDRAIAALRELSTSAEMDVCQEARGALTWFPKRE
jgi:hypothetical protein